MKILQVINSLKGGGAEKLTLDLHAGYLDRGIDSYAVGLEDSSGELPNTYTIGLRSCYQLSALIELMLFLKQPQWKEMDIIHVHLFPSQIYVPFLCRILGIKTILITTEHNTLNKRVNTFTGRIIDSLVYNNYRAIICISQGTLKMMNNWQPKLSDRMSIIYNGINTNTYKTIESIESKQEIPIIVSVGRLVEQKNYKSAIVAMSKIIDRDFEYWIVGAGVLEIELKNFVKSLNIEHKIKFLGFREDIPNILAQADIFLQTSLWEGFGLAVVEGMAAGLPVIVSNVPGVQEVVGDRDKCGFLIDPSSEDEIAEKVSTLIDNPSLRENMGRNAQTRASDFNVDRTISEHIELYCNLVKL
jgi:glycosyltransferase involved in cell wall biosynthesis